MTILQFAATYRSQALAVKHTYGVNPVVVLAVASWESGFGSSTNAKVGNNFFGVKAGKTKSPYATGKRVAPDGGYYLTYPSVEASFLDFGRVIAGRYPNLVKLSNDPYQFAKAFMASGYMTDPNRYQTYYPHILRCADQLTPLFAVSGLAIGGLVLAGLTVYFTKKYLLR